MRARIQGGSGLTDAVDVRDVSLLVLANDLCREQWGGVRVSEEKGADGGG